MKHLICYLLRYLLRYLSLYEVNNIRIWRYVELADCCSYVNMSCFLYVCMIKLSFINEKRFNYAGR